MILRWVLFGEIFGQIGFSCFIKHVVMALLGLILYPIEPHLRLFGRFSWMVLSSIPYMVELYVRMGFACCVWLISSVVTLTGYPASALWNNSPTSFCYTNDMTYVIILESVRVSPLYSLVLLKNLVPKKNVFLWILARNSDRYDSLFCMRKFIPLECNINFKYLFVSQ